MKGITFTLGKDVKVLLAIGLHGVRIHLDLGQRALPVT